MTARVGMVHNLRNRCWPFAALGLAVLASLVVFRNPTVQANSDIGYRDFSFEANSVVRPTGEKPQSKLWFQDGVWWGSLFNRSAEEYHIYRLDWASQVWSDTGILIDERNTSHADCLWDGAHLYVATAVPDTLSGPPGARLLRFSYNPASQRYSLDAGFPVTIADGILEAIVLDQDTAGTLWATYTQNNQVYVNHSIQSDLQWATPFPLPAGGINVNADDISALIAFSGQIGVMWSNQNDNTMYWAVHRDGDPYTAWQPSQAAYQGPKYVDDHLNLKSLQNDGSGRVFAAIKTSLNDYPNPDPNWPLVVLLVLDPNGAWNSYTFGTMAQNHTRPIVEIDSEHRQLYVFAGIEHGESVYYKQTSLDAIAFAPGLGIPFIQSTTDTHVNTPSSTKQNLSSQTGLVVLASDDNSHEYLHNAISLVGSSPTPSGTPTHTPSTAPTSTSTATATSTPNWTNTPTPTPTPTATPTSMPLFTATRTPLPTNTSTGSSTSTPTNTSTATNTPTLTPTATGNLVQNPGFESGPGSGWTEFSSSHRELITTGWPHSGSYSAVLCNYNDCTEYIQQPITIPAGASLRYWWYMTSQENPNKNKDHLKVALYRLDGSLLSTLRDWSSRDPRNAWGQDTLSLSAWVGQTVLVRFTGTTNGDKPTSFTVDDVSVP